ncbi:4,5-dihydroxyphthalate decarboxylase [Pseudochelatococcus lubricantis]|uniref:4,5-dihydroxyphthalate decarboxylase n=1 Tax=Pseudochelatococcus lubricantis TaxID=1538102 RepID=A0ABX0UUH8_9HYPH|nr:ABC transporter substrate-binding protein [Pseudochelatococcus lubricantis]NIJ56614.1 4,5-dihydroxyphthalate decarboxylase [Pseudochelatococcus lubricantis]
MTLPLTIACGEYDRTRALFEGSVAIEGCAANFIPLAPEEIFYRAFTGGEFDVAELSLSTYLIQTARGECEYIGIPAFVSRSFRHSAFYVRSDRVGSPSDLVQARVGVPEYQVTAAVWARGILEDEYGVKPRDINWVTGGVEDLGRHEKVPIELPPEIRVETAPRPLAQMLADGEIDAILAPRAPSCFTNRVPNVTRLFEDYRAVEADYFRKTGIFPIMHLIGVRKSAVGVNPWLPGSLLKAFEHARRASLPTLSDATALHVSLPWLIAEAEWTRSVMGPEPWPYGVEANRRTIDVLLRYHFDQGLSCRLLTVDDIFAEGTHDHFRI